MPGISVLQGDFRDHSIESETLFDAVCYFDEYDTDMYVDQPATVAGATGYDDYPVERFETDDAIVLLEGFVYDSFDPATLVGALDGNERDTLTDWVAHADGDFLVVVVWKADDRVAVLNDTFARLPAYYTTIGGTTVVTRELGFVRAVARQFGNPVGLDQLAAAQQLVFEYPLGTRTLFDGVKSIPPGSLVRIDDGVRVDRLHQYDFGRTVETDRDSTDIAAELADRLVTSCAKRQVSGARTILSLSGGLDSRVVLAGYAATDADFETVTFDKENGLYEDDIRIARSLADALGVEWSAYEVGATDRDRSQLLDLKQGMNNVSMAYMVDFFDQLRTDHGFVTYATGDGGHRALVDETPPREPTSQTDLVDQLLESNARFVPAQAAALTGIEEDAIYESIHARFDSYPEDDLPAKYDHFMFRERGLNFIQHGEDRNRYFCWSVSPFYAPDVFRYAIACPTEYKHNRNLFAALLEELAPEFLQYDYANVGAPLGSLEFRVKEYVIEQIMRHKRVKDVVARLLKDDSEATRTIARRLRTHLQTTEDLSPLAADEVASVASDPGSYRPYGLNTLYTLTMLAADLQAVELPTEPHPASQ